jgi:hypothetical protein
MTDTPSEWCWTNKTAKITVNGTVKTRTKVTNCHRDGWRRTRRRVAKPGRIGSSEAGGVAWRAAESHQSSPAAGEIGCDTTS